MATTDLYFLLPGSDGEPSTSKTRVSLANLTFASCPLAMSDMLVQIKRLERRTFPKQEAMDFDAELKKRNTELIVVLDTFPSKEALDFAKAEASRQTPQNLLDVQAGREKLFSSSEKDELPKDQATTALVVAYVLYARSAGVSLLHKVCVAEKYRRQGIAHKLLEMLKAKLEAQGCEKIQLWVDWQRDSAIELYKTVGFRRIDGARDYYGVGRHGVKMAIDLNWVW